MRAERRVVSVYRCEATTSRAFQRECRLTQKHEYDHVLKSRAAIRLSCGCFKVIAMQRDAGEARLGLIVGKRQLKRAIDRNRVKRIVRESFRAVRTDLPSVDIVFQLVNAPDGRFERDIVLVWKRLRDRSDGANDVA
jgi:ribonuclease P protein component